MRVLLVLCFVAVLSACVSTKKVSLSEATTIEQRAEEYYLSANLQLAEAEYRSLIKISPRYATAWFRLGNIYLRTNQLDAAIEHYEMAIKYDKTLSKAWHNLALARVRQATTALVESQSYIEKNNSAEVNFLLKKLLELQKAG